MSTSSRHSAPIPRIAVLAALDTKGEEARFLCDELRELGSSPMLIDFGVLGEPPGAEVGRSAVAMAGGESLAVLQAARDAGRAGRVMASGLRQIILQLATGGEISAVIAIGGSKGTSIACEALRALPFGFPKVMVTPAASGNTRRFIGGSDIILVPTVADLLGLNRVTQPILADAAAIVATLAQRSRTQARRGATVAVTSFGVTTPCAERVRHGLLDQGWEVVVFPASGVGGEAMEDLIRAGAIDGVIDLTTTELADELVGGTCSAGPSRLEAAGVAGIPLVVSLGAFDMVNFGPLATVPPQFANRQLYQHSTAVTLMRTTVEENRQLGELIADKVNRATGPCAVVIPIGGVSDYDRPGGPFFDPAADAACFTALRSGLAAHVRLIESVAHINDPEFADLLVESYVQLAGALVRS